VTVEEDHVLSHPERRKPRGIGRAGDGAERRGARTCADADRGETDLHAPSLTQQRDAGIQALHETVALEVISFAVAGDRNRCTHVSVRIGT
jgi:hypothetical protein